MDRAVRFSLFALGIFIGSVFIAFVTQSSDDDHDDVVEDQDEILVDNGRKLNWLGEEFAQVRAEQVLEDTIGEAREKGREALNEEGLDNDDFEAQVRARSKARADLITAAVAAEAADPEWGPATEQQMVERFAAKAPAGFELISTTCKTSLCIAEITTPSRKASLKQTRWHRFFGLSRAYIHHRGEEGDRFRTVVFLARDGHSLPK